MTGKIRKRSGRPERGEYAEYAKADIDFVRGNDAADALREQSRAVTTLLDVLTDEQVTGLTYAPGKWTLKEVVGHLIDDERIFAYRLLCIARGDTRPLPGFEENEYVAATSFESRAMASLIAEYQAVRESTLAFLESLRPEEWLRRGTVNGYEASVRGLAFHIAGHELHHLRIVNEKYLPKLE